MKEIREIPIEKIVPNRNQPRLEFDEDAIKYLADSILENGLIQPITVRPYVSGKYEIIAGERRFRAFKSLGRKAIPAIVADKDDFESANLALVENTQRSDLNAIEEAMAILKVMETQKKTQTEIARELGYNQSTVANKLRLLKLPDYIKQAIASGEITERHGRALLNAPEENLKEVFDTIMRRGYNVKKTEEYLQALKEKDNRKVKPVSNAVKLGVNTIYEAYELCKSSGLDVTINETNFKNEVKLTIRFNKVG